MYLILIKFILIDLIIIIFEYYKTYICKLGKSAFKPLLSLMEEDKQNVKVHAGN